RPAQRNSHRARILRPLFAEMGAIQQPFTKCIDMNSLFINKILKEDAFGTNLYASVTLCGGVQRIAPIDYARAKAAIAGNDHLVFELDGITEYIFINPVTI